MRQGKPAPGIFLKAAARAGLMPADAVVVEDAPVGIAAALAGGMRAIGFIGTHPRARLEAGGAHAVVERLVETTPELIASLLERSGTVIRT
jgi:beta-phosphoglucomutase